MKKYIIALLLQLYAITCYSQILSPEDFLRLGSYSLEQVEKYGMLLGWKYKGTIDQPTILAKPALLSEWSFIEKSNSPGSFSYHFYSNNLDKCINITYASFDLFFYLRMISQLKKLGAIEGKTTRGFKKAETSYKLNNGYVVSIQSDSSQYNGKALRTYTLYTDLFFEL